MKVYRKTPEKSSTVCFGIKISPEYDRKIREMAEVKKVKVAKTIKPEFYGLIDRLYEAVMNTA